MFTYNYTELPRITRTNVINNIKVEVELTAIYHYRCKRNSINKNQGYLMYYEINSETDEDLQQRAQFTSEMMRFVFILCSLMS